MEKSLQQKLGILLVISTFILMWGSFVLANFWNNSKEQIIYKEPETVYETVNKIVEKDVYRQETPIIPAQRTGKEIILLDKSGSMKEFVTELYTSNVNFFTNNDVWAFDTDVSKNVNVYDIEFGGNTNLIQAVNMAAENGYDTIWLCSDLEHNTGSFELVDAVRDINIIIYAPKPIDREKTQKTIQAFKDQECHVKIITMS